MNVCSSKETHDIFGISVSSILTTEAWHGLGWNGP